MRTIRESVGQGGKNNRDDVALVLSWLWARKKQTWYEGKLAQLALPDLKDERAAAKLGPVIKEFQRLVQDSKKADGLVTPDGDTVYFVGGVRRKGKQIVVDLDDQNLFAYEADTLVYEFNAASGDEKHPTALRPSLHKITRRHEIYRSRKYNAQMNYALFFTADGKAIHQSNAVGISSILKSLGVDSLGSHGCVRLAEDNAKKLFPWAPYGAPVFIDMCRDGLE